MSQTVLDRPHAYCPAPQKRLSRGCVIVHVLLGAAQRSGTSQVVGCVVRHLRRRLGRLGAMSRVLSRAQVSSYRISSRTARVTRRGIACCAVYRRSAPSG